MFLRLSPICPNWFLNASSAVVGVPFYIFASATVVGIMPYTLILIKTGLMLDEVSHIGFDLNVSIVLATRTAQDLLMDAHKDVSSVEHDHSLFLGLPLTDTYMAHEEGRQNGQCTSTS